MCWTLFAKIGGKQKLGGRLQNSTPAICQQQMFDWVVQAMFGMDGIGRINYYVVHVQYVQGPPEEPI